jgi:hypothetical protein
MRFDAGLRLDCADIAAIAARCVGDTRQIDRASQPKLIEGCAYVDDVAAVAYLIAFFVANAIAHRIQSFISLRLVCRVAYTAKRDLPW